MLPCLLYDTGSVTLDHIGCITVGSGPLVCLSPMDTILWGCSGNDAVTIDIEKFEIIK